MATDAQWTGPEDLKDDSTALPSLADLQGLPWIGDKGHVLTILPDSLPVGSGLTAAELWRSEEEAVAKKRRRVAGELAALPALLRRLAGDAAKIVTPPTPNHAEVRAAGAAARKALTACADADARSERTRARVEQLRSARRERWKDGAATTELDRELAGAERDEADAEDSRSELTTARQATAHALGSALVAATGAELAERRRTEDARAALASALCEALVTLEDAAVLARVEDQDLRGILHTLTGAEAWPPPPRPELVGYRKCTARPLCADERVPVYPERVPAYTGGVPVDVLLNLAEES